MNRRDCVTVDYIVYYCRRISDRQKG